MLAFLIRAGLSCVSCPGRPFPGCLFWVSCPWCPVPVVLSWLSCPRYLLDVLSLICLGCPIPDVMSRVSCSGCPVLGVLSWVSCPGCPVPDVLFQVSCPIYLVPVVLPWLPSWLTCLGGLVLAILSCVMLLLSCPAIQYCVQELITRYSKPIVKPYFQYLNVFLGLISL
jgi:hypothetical protein